VVLLVVVALLLLRESFEKDGITADIIDRTEVV
jgi:hypothetical protein